MEPGWYTRENRRTDTETLIDVFRYLSEGTEQHFLRSQHHHYNRNHHRHLRANFYYRNFYEYYLLFHHRLPSVSIIVIIIVIKTSTTANMPSVLLLIRMCVVASVYVKYFISDKSQGKKNTWGQVLHKYIVWRTEMHDLVSGYRIMEHGCV